MFQRKVVEKIKIHILWSVTFSESHALYDIMPKNEVKPDRAQTIWRLRVSCWISKAKREQPHSRYGYPNPYALTDARTLTHTLAPKRERTYTHRKLW